MIKIQLSPITSGRYAVVDECDADLARYCWSLRAMTRKSGRMERYAYRWIVLDGRRKRLYLHQAILGEKVGFEIDHKDQDGLNNHRENLRFVTKAQNQWNARRRQDNASGYRGVSFEAFSGKWKVTIQKNKKRITVGRFLTKEAAMEARVKASVEMFGEYRAS